MAWSRDLTDESPTQHIDAREKQQTANRQVNNARRLDTPDKRQEGGAEALEPPLKLQKVKTPGPGHCSQKDAGIGCWKGPGLEAVQ